MASTNRAVSTNRLSINLLAKTPSLAASKQGLQTLSHSSGLGATSLGVSALTHSDVVGATNNGLATLVKSDAVAGTRVGLQVLSFNNGFNWEQYHPLPPRQPSDLTVAAQQAILDLVNAKNAERLIYGLLTFDNVTVGNPQVADGFHALNTIITITAKPNQPYIQDVTVNYDRIDLSALTAALGNTLSVPSSSTKIADLIVPFNTAFSTNLGSEDIVDGDLPDLSSGEPVSVTIVATSSSLNYRGSAVLQVTGT